VTECEASFSFPFRKEKCSLDFSGMRSIPLGQNWRRERDTHSARCSSVKRKGKKEIKKEAFRLLLFAPVVGGVTSSKNNKQ